MMETIEEISDEYTARLHLLFDVSGPDAKRLLSKLVPRIQAASRAQIEAEVMADLERRLIALPHDAIVICRLSIGESKNWSMSLYSKDEFVFRAPTILECLTAAENALNGEKEG